MIDIAKISVIGKLLAAPKLKDVKNYGKVLSLQIGREHNYGPKPEGKATNMDIFFVDYYGKDNVNLFKYLKIGDYLYVDGEFCFINLQNSKMSLIRCNTVKVLNSINNNTKAIRIDVISEENEENVKL